MINLYRNNILRWRGGQIDFSHGCVIMGILNVTPDSFSDGGAWSDADSAVAHGVEMAENGAAIIDVGPESTRPGSQPVAASEQIRRAIPVIERLAKKISIPVSIDTRDFEVAAAALDAGASFINDITALADEKMMHLAADRQTPVCLMHIQGTPQTMQKQPHYDDVVCEVLKFLIERAGMAEAAGIKKEMIFIDPGIGFGKTLQHNLELIRNLEQFTASGYRVLVGVSRKRFIGDLTGVLNPAERIYGTAAAVAIAAIKGVNIVRVHDVEMTRHSLAVANAILPGQTAANF